MSNSKLAAASSSEQPLERAFDYYERLGRVREYVEERIGEDISMADAAAVAGLSPKYFSAFFHEHTGVCFRDWLAGVRIEHARRLIEEHNYSITRVAFSVGFRDLRTFQRAFKRVVGTTPRAYKKTVAP